MEGIKNGFNHAPDIGAGRLYFHVYRLEILVNMTT